jgi:tRNA (pseudouridine54-N1)-methyltransferase
MRRFIVVGQKARASADFLLVDIPSTSGRLDVLLRALRSALLISHGVRKDTVVYLVLLGEPDCARTVRIDGAAARYLRPDERSLATTLKKALATPSGGIDGIDGAGFVPVRPGISVANGGIESLLPELQDCRLYLLEEAAADIRQLEHLGDDAAFVLGDHLGLSPTTRAELLSRGAQPISVGPKVLHTEDVVALVANELDRREPIAEVRGTVSGV